MIESKLEKEKTFLISNLIKFSYFYTRTHTHTQVQTVKLTTFNEGNYLIMIKFRNYG